MDQPQSRRNRILGRWFWPVLFLSSVIVILSTFVALAFASETGGSLSFGFLILFFFLLPRLVLIGVLLFGPLLVAGLLVWTAYWALFKNKPREKAPETA